MADLTDARIKDASCDADLDGKDKWVSEKSSGLFARCTPKGAVFLYFRYWHGGRGGRPRQIPIGRLGETLPDGTKLTVEKARRQAAIERGKVRAGEDPAADRRLQRDRLKAETFADGWTLYKAAKGKGNRTWVEYQRLIDHDALPTLGSRPLAAITEEHIDDLIERVRARKPSIGRALFAALRPCFKWLRAKRYIAVNPMAELEQPEPLKRRKRYLSEKELAAYWRATEQLGFPWTPIFRLLVLTACRREEVAGMEWAELDKSVWTIPDTKTKNGEPHIIDLPPLAHESIKGVPMIYDLCFSTTGHSAPSGFSKAKLRLDALMRADIGAFEPFRLHDLRRTIKTTLQEKHSVAPHVTEAMLNHIKQGIEATYDVATYRKERKEALVKWANYVLEIADRKEEQEACSFSEMQTSE